MAYPNIEQDECIGCGVCVDGCPASVLDLVEETATVVDADACIACEACVDSCPTGAISELIDE